MISMGEEEEDEDVERMEEGGRKGSGQAKLWLMGKKNEHVAEHDDAVDDTLRKGTRRTKKTNIFDSKLFVMLSSVVVLFHSLQLNTRLSLPQLDGQSMTKVPTKRFYTPVKINNFKATAQYPACMCAHVRCAYVQRQHGSTTHTHLRYFNM